MQRGWEEMNTTCACINIVCEQLLNRLNFVLNRLQSLGDSVDVRKIDRAHDVLQDQREISRLLSTLSEVSQAAANRFQAEVQRRFFQHGISKLPCKIVIKICELVHIGTVDQRAQALERFQLICRRFRTISLGHASLWTYIDDRMSPERMDLQISRCADEAMSFHILHGPAKRGCTCETWAKIRGLRHLWTIGEVEFRAGSEGLDHNCLSTLEGWELPRVTQLKLTIVDHPFAGAVVASWALPVLGHLAYYSKPSVPLPFARAVKSLDFFACCNESWLERIAQLLATPLAASVTCLSITCKTNEVYDGEEPNYVPVVIPEQVQELRIDAIHGMIAHNFFHQLELIELKNVKDITVKVDRSAFEISSVYEWMKDWYKVLGKYPLRSLSVLVLGDVPIMDNHDIRSAVYNCLSEANEQGIEQCTTTDIIIHSERRDPPLRPFDFTRRLDCSSL